MAMSEIEWMEIFSTNLREILHEYGMSQAELADELGVTQAAVSKYLNAKIMPSPKVLNNLADIFDVDIYDILYFGDRIV